MLRKLASALAALALFAGPALAQSVQPTAPTALVNPTVQGHAGVYNPSGLAAPTVSACGTNTITGTDVSGTVVVSAGTPTSCTITFTTAWQNTPVCLWATSAGTNLTTVSTSKTASTVTIAAGANATLGYVCIGQGL
jgi:hypothetical protein